MFPYIGGKSHHVKWLNELFPEKFSTFVEVFGGAGWVSWKSNKVDQSTVRVYNDFNPLLANTFECFRSKSQQLLSAMEATPKSNEQTYKDFQQELFVDLDWNSIQLGDVDLALKYLYLETQSFSGNTLSAKSTVYFTDVKSNGKYPSKYDTLIKKLKKSEITNRLSRITNVENVDCVDLIKKYDSEDTFFYVDPPYYKMESYYSKDFPREKHQELAQTLTNIKGKFALSYYDFDDLKEFYPPGKFTWHKQKVYRSSATRGSLNVDSEEYSSKSKGTEIVIMNYVPSENTTKKKPKVAEKKELKTTFDLVFENLT